MTIENNAPSPIERVLIRIGVVVFSLVLAARFFACTPADNKSAVPAEKVTIAYSATLDSSLAQIAQVQGFYLQEGLETTTQKHALGKFALQSLIEGKADFATVAETPLVFAILNGEKLSVVATIQTSSENYKVIARKDKGLSSPSDLRGRKIAATFGTSGEYFMDAFLSFHGISRNEVKAAGLKPNELADAFVDGSVDAISALPSLVIPLQKKLGDKVITFDSEGLFTQFFVVVAREELVRSHPGKVKKLLQALKKAEGFLHQNRDQAQKIVADFCGINIDTVREGWDINRFEVSMDQSLLLAMEDLSRWAAKNRLTTGTKAPNYLDYMYLDGLASVKPEAVRILR